MVLANGLGGSYLAWRHIVAALEGYRVISWDYRGMFRSECPPRSGSLDVPCHVADLYAILRAERTGSAVLVGWSMGVQVDFEFYRRHPRMVAGLVCINGVAGRPFDTAFGSALLRQGIPLVLQVMKRGPRLTRAAVRRGTGWRALVPMMQRLGLVAPTLDVGIFEDLAREFVNLDFRAYANLFAHLGEHDARAVLPDIAVPTLIMTGDRDMLTPVATARRLHRAIRGSRLRVIAGGTHYTPVEYPLVVAAEILRFLDEAGWKPRSVPSDGLKQPRKAAGRGKPLTGI
ncbi:MAG: alpha/beta hydrolase [Myxococcota bacterium]